MICARDLMLKAHINHVERRSTVASHANVFSKHIFQRPVIPQTALFFCCDSVACYRQYWARALHFLRYNARFDF